MLLEEQNCNGIQFSSSVHRSHPAIFNQIAPASFAERFPRLTILAVAATILLATLTAEIECLRNSGYFWR
jgi:hypothetical protein